MTQKQLKQILDKLIDNKSLKDKSNGRYNREIELRDKIKEVCHYFSIDNQSEQDWKSVLGMLEGSTERQKIINYIKEYIL